MSSNQRGAAAVFAIFVTLILSIMAAGLAFMLNTEVLLSTKSRDVIEAQYAAEAGAKRAIVNFLQKSTDWSWLGADRNLVRDDDTKTYRVTVSPVLTEGAEASANSYTVTSIGRVGNATKTIIIPVTVTEGGGQAPVSPTFAGDCAIYAGGEIDFKNKGLVYDASTVSGERNSADYSINDPYKKYQYKTLPMPQYTVNSFIGAQTIPVGDNVELNGIYVVYGDWVISNNSSFTGDATIYVAGNIVMPTNYNFNGQFLIIASEDIDGSNSNNNVIENAVLISYGDIEFKNNLELNGAMMAAGNIYFKNKATITYNPDTIKHFKIPANPTGESGSGNITIGVWKSQ